MTTLRTAAQQALETLEVATNCLDGYYIPRGKTTLPEIEDAITALKAALAEPVQEPTVPSDCTDSHQPVGWFEGPFGEFRANPLHRIAWPAQTVAWSIPLYLAQPQRKPLSADETMSILNETAGHHWCDEAHLQRFRAAIERAHGIGDKDGPQG